MKHKAQSTKHKVKRKIIILLTTYFLILSTLMGCEAFVRKFTRKPKKDQGPKEEMVLAPQEYKPTMSNQEQYRQYFLFWKSWQDELISALTSRDPNHKKQVACANEAIKNLVSMRLLLNNDGQKKLDAYINRMTDLRDAVDQDDYSTNVFSNRLEAERVKRDILQNFSFGDIKKSLI